MSTLIKQARLIDPKNNIDDICDILVNDAGTIEAIDKNIDLATNTDTIDAQGKWLLPGIIDLATRLREPGEEHKGTIHSETKAAVAGGITTVCIQPDTKPTIDEPAVAELILRRNRDAGFARVIPLAALTKKLQGEQLTEAALLLDAGCAALSDGGKPVKNAMVLRRAIDYADSYDIPVMLTPENHDLAANGCAHDGTLATRMGLIGIPSAAESVTVGRYIALAQETGAKLHICRLSAQQSVWFLEASRSHGLTISSDVAIHQLFLSEMDIAGFDSACHVRPPLRRHEDRDALRSAISSGLIKAVTSDHQPHEPDAKLAPFPATEPGISGLETLLNLTLRLVEDNVVSIGDAISLLTTGPAEILGIDRGHLSIGADADFSLFDPSIVWRGTPENWHSAGRNSPFLNWEFTGKVIKTFVQGKCVYSQT